MSDWLLRIWKENRSFVVFIILMLVFRSSIADWNVVPTGSMKPTVIEGDRILVNKLAYDIQVPFTGISLFEHSGPVRGDIVVFDSAKSGKRLVKRVVGVPGDTVEMIDNRLIVNGNTLLYEHISSTGSEIDKVENLLGVEHFVRQSKRKTRRSNFRSVTIPDRYYLVLGDNRDNSADSRVIGLVPRSEIVGRSRSVVLSSNYDNYYIPRSDRFFHTL